MGLDDCAFGGAAVLCTEILGRKRAGPERVGQWSTGITSIASADACVNGSGIANGDGNCDCKRGE